jgi:hypothetical protein
MSLAGWKLTKPSAVSVYKKPRKGLFRRVNFLRRPEECKGPYRPRQS